MGCKGIIDATSTCVKSSPGDLCFLEGQLLSEVIGAGDLPVCAENDARVALIGEVLWGAARGRRNVVMLTLGTGVGGAVLVDGVILHGAHGAAGHLGHTTIDTARRFVHLWQLRLSGDALFVACHRIRLLGAHPPSGTGDIVDQSHRRSAESRGHLPGCCRG